MPEKRLLSGFGAIKCLAITSVSVTTTSHFLDVLFVPILARSVKSILNPTLCLQPIIILLWSPLGTEFGYGNRVLIDICVKEC